MSQNNRGTLWELKPLFSGHLLTIPLRVLPLLSPLLAAINPLIHLVCLCFKNMVKEIQSEIEGDD